MKMSENEASAAVLNEIAVFLRKLTPDDVGRLINGDVRIVLLETGRRATGGAKSAPSASDLATIRTSLQEVTTRDEGRKYLDGLGLTRPALQRLAVAMDMAVRKSDTVEMIKDSIVEAAVGFRLRSNAIRGLRSEGDSNAGGL